MIKQNLFNHLKNLPGWKTRRKLVAFAVDDYGNVRSDSAKAVEAMEKAGLNLDNRFDRYDTLETREDLEMLYEVLDSVKDKHQNPAVFTPYALSWNMNFEAMKEGGYETYIPEPVPETYRKLEAMQPGAYAGGWALWQEGIEKGLMKPEFHGREHFNLKVITEKLNQKDSGLLTAFGQRSLAGVGPTGYPSIGWTAAFSFWDPGEDTRAIPEIMATGVKAFKEVYGYAPRVFTAPAQQFPEFMEQNISHLGIRAMDRPLYQARHRGLGKYRRQWVFPSYKKNKNLTFLVRNVVFEPTNSNIDHVSKAMAQVAAAFRWGRPALISSHRVNFCGHIDPKNREKGLGDLKDLLRAIVKRWPEVEFVSAGDLAELMRES